MSKLSLEVKEYFDSLKSGCTNLITSEDLVKKMESKEKMFILDIRKKIDFDKGHIKGSFHVDWPEVGECIEENVFKKDEPIVVVCYTGQTAGQTVGILKAMGYDALSLKGGVLNSSISNELSMEKQCDT